jgi:hypothetical protein
LDYLIFGTPTADDNQKKIEEIERNYQKKELSLKASFKIQLAEKEEEIDILEAKLKTKESIIGVLKERNPDY